MFYKLPLLLLSTFFVININNFAFAGANNIKQDIKISSVINLDNETDKTNEKNPFLSAGLSFVIPGSGQIYNGEYIKGILLFSGIIALSLAEIYFVGPNLKIAEKDNSPNKSFFEMASLVTRIGTPSLWFYSWGSAYQSVDPDYQKKLREEEKKKQESQKNISNIFDITLFSYKF